MRHLIPLRYIDVIARTGSIRKAADTLAITSTALNRRVLAMEEELGVAIFERLPRGVRLTTAGEILLHHARTQLADMDRVKSQIADLTGVRRGHVAIACSQALLPYFLPEQIARYRTEHPGVTFGVHLRDRAAAEQALVDHVADLAIVFEPIRMGDFQTLASLRQPVHVVMANNHPLAARKKLRLGECLQYPISLPAMSYGVRDLLETAITGTQLKLHPAIESDSFEFLRNHAATEPVITFQIAIGLPEPDPKTIQDNDQRHQNMTHRPLDPRDVPAGLLYVGQLRGRTLPVAAARFANQIVRSLNERFPD